MIYKNYPIIKHKVIFKETNKEFTNTYRPSHLGVKVGKVISTKNDKVQIKLSDGVRQKDKIAIVQDKFEDIRMFLSKIYVKGKLVAQGYKDEIIEKINKLLEFENIYNNYFILDRLTTSITPEIKLICEELGLNFDITQEKINSFADVYLLFFCFYEINYCEPFVVRYPQFVV